MNKTPEPKRKILNPIKILLHVPVPWVFVLAYLIGVGLEFLFQLKIIPVESISTIKIAGIVLLVIGAALAAWCLFIFHKLQTTTTPGEVSTNLVTWGPYRLSRNPMYVSLILAYLGEAGLLVQFMPIVILPFTVAYINWIVIPLEETRLKEVFGVKYESYFKDVRRWL